MLLFAGGFILVSERDFLVRSRVRSAFHAAVKICALALFRSGNHYGAVEPLKVLSELGPNYIGLVKTLLREDCQIPLAIL